MNARPATRAESRASNSASPASASANPPAQPPTSRPCCAERELERAVELVRVPWSPSGCAPYQGSSGFRRSRLLLTQSVLRPSKQGILSEPRDQAVTPPCMRWGPAASNKRRRQAPRFSKPQDQALPFEQFQQAGSIGHPAYANQRQEIPSHGSAQHEADTRKGVIRRASAVLI